MLQEVVHMIQENTRKHLKKCHTAFPGKVVKYYPERGMCDIQPVMQFKKPNGEWIDYPELKDVPVWWPQSYGQTSTIVYPIKKNDEVLVLVAERPIDFWLFGMQTEQDLMFDLSEAVCIPGLFAEPNALAKTAQDHLSIIIQRKDNFIEIKPNDIIIDAQRDTIINVLRDVTVNADRNVTVNAEKDVTVNADQDAILNVERDAIVNAEHDITINADVEPVEEGDDEVDPGIIMINAGKEIIMNAEDRIELNAEEILMNGEGASPGGDIPDPSTLGFDPMTNTYIENLLEED